MASQGTDVREALQGLITQMKYNQDQITAYEKESEELHKKALHYLGLKKRKTDAIANLNAMNQNLMAQAKQLRALLPKPQQKAGSRKKAGKKSPSRRKKSPSRRKKLKR